MVEYALSETRNGDKQMKRLAKKLCVCFLAAILGIMPGIVTDAKAASYQWYYNGNYNSIEEARNYSIVNDDHAAAAVGGYINLDSEDSYVGKEHPDAEYEWSTSNQNVKMDVSTDKKSAKITGKVKGSTKVTLTITYKEEIIDNNENTGSNEKMIITMAALTVKMMVMMTKTTKKNLKKNSGVQHQCAGDNTKIKII